jgi:hypothetical protein
MMTRKLTLVTLTALGAFLFLSQGSNVQAEPITNITIDGDFSDWASVPTHTDPNGAPGVLHNGVPDIHDTDQGGLFDVPSYVDHPDVDILEYKFTHDENNLYAYFKADGIIGNTQEATPDDRAGRYYVIVTIDVDNDDSTGYFLHEGGYYPTSGVEKYDMNMEAEFYDGELNTAHYLSHDATDQLGLSLDFKDLTQGQYPANGATGTYPVGFVQPAPGNYDEYTQWVYHDNDTLTLVVDKGPVVPGIMTVQLSADGHEIEICAPYKGFLDNAGGNPNMALGNTIDISFSLEASGELAPGGDWASDTADPIVGYYLGAVPEPSTIVLMGFAVMGMVMPRRNRRTLG